MIDRGTGAHGRRPTFGWEISEAPEAWMLAGVGDPIENPAFSRVYVLFGVGRPTPILCNESEMTLSLVTDN